MGYHVGHEDPCKSDATRLLFVTAGMLRKYVTGALRQLHLFEHTDRGIRESTPTAIHYASIRSAFPYDFVLVDEVHERSVDCDMALLLLKYLAVRVTTAALGKAQLPIFRIVVMSATISSNEFARFLGGESLNMFEAEHAVWEDQTFLLRIKEALEEVKHLRASLADSMVSCEDEPLKLEMHQQNLHQRERVIHRAKELSSSLNRLINLWKYRRSRGLLAMFRDQQASMNSRDFRARQQWKRISGSAVFKGNCVNVSDQTQYPVEELFWDDLGDLALAPFTCSATLLLDIASPTLLRFMGIQSNDYNPVSTSLGDSQHEVVREGKPLANIATGSDYNVDEPSEEDSYAQWEDDGSQEDSRLTYCLHKPRLNCWALERAARLLLLIHTQALRRNAPQKGALVFLPGRQFFRAIGPQCLGLFLDSEGEIFA